MIAELDVLQFEVERDRFRADLDAARNEEAAAWRRLAAEVGAPLTFHFRPLGEPARRRGCLNYGFDEAPAKRSCRRSNRPVG